MYVWYVCVWYVCKEIERAKEVIRALQFRRDPHIPYTIQHCTSIHTTYKHTDTIAKPPRQSKCQRIGGRKWGKYLTTRENKWAYIHTHWYYTYTHTHTHTPTTYYIYYTLLTRQLTYTLLHLFVCVVRSLCRSRLCLFHSWNLKRGLECAHLHIIFQSPNQHHRQLKIELFYF